MRNYNKNCDSTWWKVQKLSEFKRSMCIVFCGETQNVNNCKSDCIIKSINIGNWDRLTLRNILKRGDRQPNK